MALESVAGVLGGCMGCMVVVENIAKQQPSAMNLMTFSTFFFIACVGLVFTSKFFTVPNKIPLSGYVKTVTMFFLVNVINNQALNFHVPVPLHIIFRSGSLLASLLLSAILGTKYGLRKWISVAVITVGIIICTLASNHKPPKDAHMSAEDAANYQRDWIIGVSMLTFALFASAVLAIFQQKMYEKHGKHPEEALFVTHAAALPMFLFMYKDIAASAATFSAGAPFTVAGVQFPVSDLWVNLIISDILQYYCILFVYRLNSQVDALTVTLVVTLRKFLSLIFSIWWFQNPFTFNHWIGAILVFAGTLAFADIWGAKKNKKE